MCILFYFLQLQMAKMEQMVQSARRHEYINWHLASHGIPKSLQCLSLILAEEYAVNAMARSRLPSPEFVSRLTDPSFHHVVLLTDNVLAASVVISSAVNSSTHPEKFVFHVVTDKKTYTAMHAWFAMNSINSAVVEVKGLHQYDWSHKVNVAIKEMLEIHHLIWKNKYDSLKEEVFEYQQELEKNLEVLSPSFVSLLNHLRIYIPEVTTPFKVVLTGSKEDLQYELMMKIDRIFDCDRHNSYFRIWTRLCSWMMILLYNMTYHLYGNWISMGKLLVQLLTHGVDVTAAPEENTMTSSTLQTQ